MRCRAAASHSDDATVLRDAQALGVHRLVEVRLRDFVLHALLQDLRQAGVPRSAGRFPTAGRLDVMAGLRSQTMEAVRSQQTAAYEAPPGSMR